MMQSYRTLSLKCPCGYIKHDVMHLGTFEQHGKRQLLDYCGGLFMVKRDISIIRFHCAFCNRVTTMGVEYRVAKQVGKVAIIQMSVHETVVFA